MKLDWKPIKTIPKSGNFLVYLEEPMHGSRIQAADWHPNIKIIGGLFSFDVPKATHWAEMPDGPQ